MRATRPPKELAKPSGGALDFATVLGGLLNSTGEAIRPHSLVGEFRLAIGECDFQKRKGRGCEPPGDKQTP